MRVTDYDFCYNSAILSRALRTAQTYVPRPDFISSYSYVDYTL